MGMTFTQTHKHKEDNQPDDIQRTNKKKKIQFRKKTQ